MSRVTTEVIECDGCHCRIASETFRLHEELDVTGNSFGVTMLGPRLDYCRKCTIAALRKRADELEAQSE